LHDNPAVKIEIEIKQIDILLNTHKLLIDLCHTKIPDSTEIAAAGAILHSFYNGIEKIFLFIAKDFDKKVPSGEKWHRELVKQMNSQTDKRNKIISDAIKEMILHYMGFCHFFRHAYDFQLDWSLLKDNFINISKNWEMIKSELDLFLK
jgi:hypothetical protein